MGICKKRIIEKTMLHGNQQIIDILGYLLSIILIAFYYLFICIIIIMIRRIY